MTEIKTHCADCADWLEGATPGAFHLSFVDPPFNQGKDYRCFDDKQDSDVYWRRMTDVLTSLRRATAAGGWVYFMQREKNAEFVLRALRESGWNFQNLVVWKKKASAVPCANKFGLHYQVIASAVNGGKARVFNRLRVVLPPQPEHKYPHENGVYVTDVWDDIRELTSGYYAGKEPLRDENGERFHKQQAPLALLARIILSSSRPGDVVFDPFAGTGTTLVAAGLLGREAAGVEIDPLNVECIQNRVALPRAEDADTIAKLYESYIHTENLHAIWGGSSGMHIPPHRAREDKADASLFAA